jgi:hypothetical protein
MPFFFFSKAVLLLQKNAQPKRNLVNKHTEWEVWLGFIPDLTLPLPRVHNAWRLAIVQGRGGFDVKLKIPETLGGKLLVICLYRDLRM